ncbi:kinase-like protein [Zopfia rhizophila CBS 207.26]|uniref:Kinase-like protein n=1 Tax=Zopfia rhizophila CBS 207.26 TaxID=1314779 RepID=A0A6A6ESJ7_9PEZI|nr:kinase-like protein [Zopfia rhizophila CBS 207.26]
MRTLNPLVLALLSGAYGANAANCNTHQARTGTGLAGKQIADELLGVLDTVSNDLCKGASSGHDAEPRIQSTQVTDCSTPFVDITSQCISQAGYWGGNSSFQGLTYEIYNEAYPASGLSKAALEIRAKPKGPKKTPPSVPAKPTSLKGKPVPTKHSSLKGKPPVPTKPSSPKGKTLTRTTAASTSSVLGYKPKKKAPTNGKPKKQTNGKPKVQARSEPSISRHARDFSVSPHSTRQLFRRVGTPPPQCQNDNAGEDQGCFTVQDEADKPVRFALPQGKTEFGGGLGAGAFVGVEKCIRKDGLDIAVKIYNDDDHPGAKKSFGFLKALEVNQNIIKAYGYGTVKGKPALAMELLTGGDVKSRIASGDWKGRAKEREFKDVGRQIINGVSHMHSKKIAHCDIQGPNVAFEGNTPKFIDFDFACQNTDCLRWVPAGWGCSACLEVNPATKQKNGIVDPYANDVWTTATMLIHMTTGAKFPYTNNRAFKSAWSEPDQSKRIAKLFKIWDKENFLYEFVELLAGIFTMEDNRIKINEFRDRFRDLPSIYC